MVYSSFLFNSSVGSSLWTKPGISVGVSRNHEPHPNQINTTNSAYTKSAHCQKAPSSQIPTVSFDLGNEWDDWSDFDDENLVHASETSSTTNAKPQVQQSADNNMPGSEAWVPLRSGDTGRQSGWMASFSTLRNHCNQAFLVMILITMHMCHVKALLRHHHQYSS